MLQIKAQQLFDLEQFNELTPIQKEIYKPGLKRKDLIAQSATGTGKTHAFLFVLAERIDPTSNNLQTMIIAPTRELATQIYQFSQGLAQIHEGLRIELVIGGLDRERMRQKLTQQPHIVIGTPGRLKDMFFDNELRLDQVDTVVLDEADMIYELGFLEDVHDIFVKMNKKTHTMVFSATIPAQLQTFIRRFLNHPLTYQVTTPSKLNPNAKHVLIKQKHKTIPDALIELLGHLTPSGCIIFANTRTEASEVASKMREQGYRLLELHGGLSARERAMTLNRIQKDEMVYLVATDLVARGLDLPHVSHVVSLGLPTHLDFYIHRAGRTGRAGKSGLVYTIVSEKDEKDINRLASTGIKFNYQTIRNQELVDVSNFYRRKKRAPKVDPEIAQILNRKKVKVKPNYKKKRNEQIQKLQRKKKREMIRKSIQEQKKERAKEKQKSKSS